MAIGYTDIGLPISRTTPTTTGTARGLWNVGTAELLTFYTSSTQTVESKDYYYEIWGSASLSCDEERMFSVSYGHVSGSGSLNEGGEADDTPSRAIYSQYKLMCLDGNEGGFQLSGSTAAVLDPSRPLAIEDFYVININRDKFGDKLDPGNFEINFAALSGSGYANNVHTGSNVHVSGSSPNVITLIDDSGDTLDQLETLSQTSYERNLVSGSLQDGIYSNSNRHYYGKVYPSQGIILVSAKALNQSASFNTVTGSNINGDNSYKIFTSISGAASIYEDGFTARAINIKHCRYYYVRVSNEQANYSSNPTFSHQSGLDKGLIKNNRFYDNPVTYITSIGLYGPDLSPGVAPGTTVLLAVAKLSKPIKKTFTNELSITIKLEY
jgi:hypothetical protein